MLFTFFIGVLASANKIVSLIFFQNEQKSEKNLGKGFSERIKVRSRIK